MGVRRSLAGIPAGILGCSVALVLGACGGGDGSVADPPVSSTTSSPTESSQHESAEHFIRRWAAEDTRIQQTGDTSTFREMSRGCKGCLRLANLVDRIYEAGGFIHTQGWRVRVISHEGMNTYLLKVLASPTTYSESKEGAVHHLPSGPAQFQLQLTSDDPSWRVTSLVQVAS
jgi:hypothetical protein